MELSAIFLGTSLHSVGPSIEGITRRGLCAPRPYPTELLSLLLKQIWS